MCTKKYKNPYHVLERTNKRRFAVERKLNARCYSESKVNCTAPAREIMRDYRDRQQKLHGKRLLMTSWLSSACRVLLERSRLAKTIQFHRKFDGWLERIFARWLSMHSIMQRRKAFRLFDSIRSSELEIEISSRFRVFFPRWESKLGEQLICLFSNRFLSLHESICIPLVLSNSILTKETVGVQTNQKFTVAHRLYWE